MSLRSANAPPKATEHPPRVAVDLPRPDATIGIGDKTWCESIHFKDLQIWTIDSGVSKNRGFYPTKNHELRILIGLEP